MEEKRIKWLDLYRVFAILAVLLCHATEGVYTINLSSMANQNLVIRVLVFTLFTFGRLGVPIFLMISGYLLLDKSYNEVTLVRFWKRNWLHLLVCTEIWFLIYEMLLSWYYGKDTSVLRVVKEILFFHKVDMSHVWYMPMLLGIYLLVPFVANALQSVKVKYLFFPMTFFTFYAFAFPTFEVINNCLEASKLNLQMSLGYSGGAYGLYIIFGYLIKKGVFHEVKSWILGVNALIWFVLTIVLQIWSYGHGIQYNVWYDCLFLLLCAMAVFELGTRIRVVPAYRLVKWLSKYSFAVYLIHNIFRMILKDFVQLLAVGKTIKVLILWYVITVLSFSCAWLISRIPKVGKYLIYIKY